LTITPWVSASGEITTEIKPEFSTPKNFDNENNTPPIIDHRILESTVRLRDGETIILGGLVHTDDSESHYKFPILGDIPGLGQLFRNRSKNKSKTKLMIYITPHLMYSSDDVLIHGIEE
jgi:type IV pilus assembly protein PilQ